MQLPTAGPPSADVLALVLRCGWLVLVGAAIVATARASYDMCDFMARLTIGDIREARRELLPAVAALAVATACAALLSGGWWGPACLGAAVVITLVNWIVSSDWHYAGYAILSFPVVAILVLAGVITTLATPR